MTYGYAEKHNVKQENMKLYIANTKSQAHWFTYRFFGNPQPMAKMIKPGGQICIQNLDQEQINAIIEQNVIYGMHPASEMSRHKGYAGTCYSVDAEINVDRMLETFDQNGQVKDAEAEQRRKDTAAAIAENIGKEIGKVGGVSDQPPANLQVQIVEDGDQPTLKSMVEVPKEPGKRATLSRR